MKKTLFSIILMLGFLSTTQAQEETRIGGFLAYGTEIESLGIGVNAEFPVMEKLSIAPSIIYYFPKEDSGFKMNWLEFNANANYYFIENDDLGVYALGGLNYSSIKVSYDDTWGMGGNFSASDGRFGLNLGGGLNFDIGSSILPFAEIKYVIIDGGQLVASAGVKLKL